MTHTTTPCLACGDTVPEAITEPTTKSEPSSVESTVVHVGDYEKAYWNQTPVEKTKGKVKAVLSLALVLFMFIGCSGSLGAMTF